MDDAEKLKEVLETGTFDTLIGPTYFGGVEVNGYGHLAVMPSVILTVTGEKEYEVQASYTADESAAITSAVFGK